MAVAPFRLVEINGDDRSYFHVFVEPDEVGRPRSRRRRGESLSLQLGPAHAHLQFFPNGHLQSNTFKTGAIFAEATYREDGSPIVVKIEAAEYKIVISWLDRPLVNGWQLTELGAHYSDYRAWYQDMSQKVQAAFEEYLGDFEHNFILPEFP